MARTSQQRMKTGLKKNKYCLKAAVGQIKSFQEMNALKITLPRQRLGWAGLVLRP